MIVTAIAYIDAPDGEGDAAIHCERLTLESNGYRESEKLATFGRVMENPETRALLLDAAEGIEAARLASEAPAPC